MNTIKLNNTEIPVTNYSKTTTFSEDTINSYAYTMVNASDMAALEALAATPITSLQIYHDGTLVYDLGEINARIDSINDSLSDDRVYTNINMTFITE